MPNARLHVCFIFIIAGLCFSANAQIIRGRVLRGGGDTAVANAVVYYGGSMTGTIADEQGRFELPAKSQQIPITVSCIGYYSSTVYYQTGKPLLVYLKPKIGELRMVTIHADGMDRKSEIARFTREFLGTSNYALNCTIENIHDVNLFYDKKTQTLTANCDKPLIINNKKLGYTITYYLDRFKDAPGEVTFGGDYIFKETVTANDKDRSRIIANREDAYDGSRMQFIRALWHNTLDKTDFKIYLNSGYAPIDPTSIIVIDSLKQKYIHFEGKLIVLNISAIQPENQVLNKNNTFIDKNGFYAPGLQWAGPMSHQRVGDLLPFEFQSKKDIKLYSEATPTLAQSAATGLSAGVSKNPTEQTVPVFFEKAYLHTDRDTYAQGEDIWFKAYVVNAQNNQSIDYSKNLYVELISPTAKIVQRKMLRLESGLGNGDFKLSDTLITGNYRLRAYTNWMRNFGEYFIFEKTIHLVNGLDQQQNQPLITSQKKKTLKTAFLPKINPDTLPVVRFFPEGGSMVSGLGSVIGVKAEDENGHGLPAAGKVMDNSGETVASFTCDSLGFGAFTLLYNTAQHYQALVTIRHLPRHFILPQVSPTGFIMHVQDKQGITTVAISCNDATFNKINGQHIYLMVQHGGKTYMRRALFLSDKDQLVKLDDNLLAEGINCITVSDEKNQPLCERLTYVHFPLTTALAINTDRPVYQPKQQVDVHFKLNMPGIARLSLAAVDELTVSVQPENIVSYLELQSEVRGHIEQAAKYFDTTNVNRFKQLDLLLLTQGWRGFVWKKLEDTTLKFDHEVEQGIAITGRVRKQWGDKPLKDIHITLNAPKAENAKYFEATTDSAGKFAIYGPVFYGYQYLYLSSRSYNVKNKGKSNSGGWLMVDSLNQDILPVHKVNNYISDTLPSPEELLMKLGIPKKQQLKEVQIVSSNYTFTPQIHDITLAEQKDYGTVRQYLLYTIESARIMVSRDGSSSGLVTGGGRSTNPVLVSSIYSDGSRIDPNIALGQDPLDLPISQMISVKLQKHFGGNGIYWTAQLKLRPGAFNMEDYFDNTTADMAGYYKAREFYKPRLGEVDDKPDLRVNTIHWEPNITTNNNGEAVINFFNTPSKGNIRIIAQGVTENGVPVMATATYKVQ